MYNCDLTTNADNTTQHYIIIGLIISVTVTNNLNGIVVPGFALQTYRYGESTSIPRTSSSLEPIRMGLTNLTKQNKSSSWTLGI